MDEQDKMDDALLGKTITGFEWRYKESPGEGFVMRFSDGSTLRAWERGQAGEINYSVTERTDAK